MSPRPVIAYRQAVTVGAVAAALAVALGALFNTHSHVATFGMVLVVVLAGAVLVRLEGWTVGPLILLITTCFVDQWVFSAGRFNVRPEQVALLFTGAAFAMDRVRIRTISSAEGLLIAWFAVALLSSVVLAQDRFESLKVLALLVISSLALFLPRRIIGGDQYVLDQVIAWMLLAFALEGAYVIAAYFLHLFGPTVALTVNPASGHLSALGTMWEPNVLGAVCGAGALAWLVFGTRHFSNSWIAVALCLTACFASFTRTAWIAVLLMMIVGVASPLRHRIDLRALSAGVLATLLLLVVVLAADTAGHYSSGGHGGVIEAVANNTDVLGRLNQVSPVLHDLEHNKLRLLIGGGVDSFSQRHVLDGVPQHLANLELTILNDTGLAGLALFAIFAAAIAMAVWRMRHDLTVIGLGAMVLLLAITNTGTDTLDLMITWLLMGLLLAGVQVAESASAARSARTYRRSAA